VLVVAQLARALDCGSRNGGSTPLDQTVVLAGGSGFGFPKSMWQVRHLPRTPCLVTRLVSRLACRASEAGSIPARGADHGDVQKAARHSCKVALRERYPTSPPMLPRLPGWGRAPGMGEAAGSNPAGSSVTRVKCSWPHAWLPTKRRRIIPVDAHAGLVQWQNAALPTLRHRLESGNPHSVTSYH